NLLDLEIEYPSVDINVSKPALLEDMIKLSAKLAAPFNHVRVDWYVVNKKLIFGEMTFFHESGFGRFNSKEWEIKMGEWIAV
ncbi:MAG: glycosyl transferase, partial [Campylobacterales bacterium]|nr:glycosyl transferase [Campylobacterales bacterium]